jgi:hypothetical protein
MRSSSRFLAHSQALAVLLGAALTGLASPAAADSRTAQAQGHAVVRVVRPIAVAGIEDLDFGMVASSGPGTVAVAPGAGLATFGGSARRACIGGGSCPGAHAARFQVAGESSRNYRIALPERLGVAGPASAHGGGQLTVADFTVRSASQPAAGAKGRLDQQGRDSFEVGGTLTIPAALPPGHYWVSVPVIVTYD